MQLAKEQRDKWRDELQKGTVPDDVRRAIELYRTIRTDSQYRSTTFIESLGEAALVLLDKLDGVK